MILTKGRVAKIDEADAEWVGRHSWQLSTGGYAYRRRSLPTVNGERGYVTIYLHRAVCEMSVPIPDGMEVDHIDVDKLNCRRDNLRPCTRAQNRRNVKAYRNNTSGAKGVWFVPSLNKWRASISVSKRAKHLGVFMTRDEAVQAYQAAAVEYFGEFAQLS